MRLNYSQAEVGVCQALLKRGPPRRCPAHSNEGPVAPLMACARNVRVLDDGRSCSLAVRPFRSNLPRKQCRSAEVLSDVPAATRVIDCNRIRAQKAFGRHWFYGARVASTVRSCGPCQGLN